LTFLNVLGDYFVSHEKTGYVAYFKKRTYGSSTSKMLLIMQPVQI